MHSYKTFLINFIYGLVQKISKYTLHSHIFLNKLYVWVASKDKKLYNALVLNGLYVWDALMPSGLPSLKSYLSPRGSYQRIWPGRWFYMGTLISCIFKSG